MKTSILRTRFGPYSLDLRSGELRLGLELQWDNYAAGH